MTDSIAMRKADQGYIPPDGRRACRTCIHGAKIPGRARRTADELMRCRRGDFLVAPMGICGDYVSPSAELQDEED